MIYRIDRFTRLSVSLSTRTNQTAKRPQSDSSYW